MKFYAILHRLLIGKGGFDLYQNGLSLAVHHLTAFGSTRGHPLHLHCSSALPGAFQGFHSALLLPPATCSSGSFQRPLPEVGVAAPEGGGALHEVDCQVPIRQVALYSILSSLSSIAKPEQPTRFLPRLPDQNLGFF